MRFSPGEASRSATAAPMPRVPPATTVTGASRMGWLEARLEESCDRAHRAAPAEVLRRAVRGDPRKELGLGNLESKGLLEAKPQVEEVDAFGAEVVDEPGVRFHVFDGEGEDHGDQLPELILDARGHGEPSHRPSTRQAFWPPKPNEFFRRNRIAAGRPVAPTSVRSTSGSCSRTLMLGGSTWWCSARTEAAVSTPPAAATRCPTCDLVEATGIVRAAGPSTWASALASVRSFIRVPVPWALTWSIFSGWRSASTRA